ARADRDGDAGHIPLQRLDLLQHRVRSRRRAVRRRRARREAGARGGVHPRLPAGLRHAGRRARRAAVRRPATAPGHRARVPQGPADSDPGRGDLRPGRGERVHGAAGAGRSDARPDRAGNRASPGHGAQRQPHRRSARRTHRRDRPPRRAHRPRRRLPPSPHAADRADARGSSRAIPVAADGAARHLGQATHGSSRASAVVTVATTSDAPRRFSETAAVAEAPSQPRRWVARGGNMAGRLLFVAKPMRARRLLRRRTVHAIAAVCVTLGALVLSDLISVTVPAPASDGPAHHGRRGFRNLDPEYAYSLRSRVVHVVGRPPARLRGRPLELVPNDGRALRDPLAAALITWIGHSTFLVQLDGVNLLTDPIWSERTSPVPFAGPRRLVPPGVRFEDLPPIHAVVVSHDHYDHLDLATVTRLARVHHPTFFVPLGLRAWFESRGIRDVVELDWWQSARIGALALTAVPAQHSSGRSLLLDDQNARLWASWV